LAVILDLNHNKYQSGTTNGTLLSYFTFNQFSKVLGIPTLHLQDVTNDKPKSLKEIARIQRITSGQGMLKCDCKGDCKTNQWKCKQAKM
jgi:hypothetical protein